MFKVLVPCPTVASQSHIPGRSVDLLISTFRGEPATIPSSAYQRQVEYSAGLTLIEVIVAVAILSILISLSLPAVQAARESARKTTCQNNLRQIALAAHQFHTVHRHLPTNGWGFAWIGSATRGADKNQPGGWVFQLLPFMEQEPLYHSTSVFDTVSHRAALGRLTQAPIPLMKCPTRPTLALGDQSTVFAYRNADTLPTVTRTDYAINEGDWISSTGAGPNSESIADLSLYPWIDATKVTGISWERGGAFLTEIKDGTSNTYFVGEKRISDSLTEWGHDQSMFSGVDIDTTRWTVLPPGPDGNLDDPVERRFGSAHSTGCYMSMCDGSVRMITYSLHPDIHRGLGNRKDGAIGE